jgi:uncharacterized Zn finger protein
MIAHKKEALWSWNYNFGRSYPMPCDKCGGLVEMEIIAQDNPYIIEKCPECGYVKRKKN